MGLEQEQGGAYGARVSMRYAMCYMYIGCKWMYVYETIAVEFEWGWIGVE